MKRNETAVNRDAGCRGNGRSWLLPALALLGLFALASPAGANDKPDVLARFEDFSRQWMAQLTRVSEQNRLEMTVRREADGYRGRYVCYGPQCRIWIKETDSNTTPFVGFIRYAEKHMVTRGSTADEIGADEGTVASEVEVTEIFRFTDGEWVY